MAVPREHSAPRAEPSFRLDDGARVAVVGGGPAGSFFGYFLLAMAERIGTVLAVDIYEPRDFSRPGAGGCNMCGGIISEEMVQLLAAEGIFLPPTVVQRGIDSYVLHMDVGSVRIEPPGREKRIAAVHRGAGPRGLLERRWGSFDGYLLSLAADRGARVVRERVEGIDAAEGKLRLSTRSGVEGPYDLVAGAVGINTSSLKLFEGLGAGYRPPVATKTFITEVPLGEKTVEACLGSAMHVFLPNLPRLEFAAIIPKGEYATVCLLGEEIDRELVAAFFRLPEVLSCFPAGWALPDDACRCAPGINVFGAEHPYGDRFVMIGDCGVTRLYKDGIGGAYRTAKAAARTALFRGVSARDFEEGYFPVCRALANDNRIGKTIFHLTRMFQGGRFSRRGVLRMTAAEQAGALPKRMSGVLWDTFTGSAPYREVLLRTLDPLFLGRLLYEAVAGLALAPRPAARRSP